MDIAWVVEKLISVIPLIGEIAKDKRELADNALKAVLLALNETSIYFESYKKSGEINDDTEQQLVRYWGAAAIPLRHVDMELSQICEYKSEYWLNPDGWENERANGVAIDLESVRKKYRNRLHANSTRHNKLLKDSL